MGITNMRSRIKRLGGLMTIESAKGREPETRCVCRSNNLTVGAYGLGQAIHPIANGALCNVTEHDPVCDAADHTNGGSNAPHRPMWVGLDHLVTCCDRQSTQPKGTANG